MKRELQNLLYRTSPYIARITIVLIAAVFSIGWDLFAHDYDITRPADSFDLYGGQPSHQRVLDGRVWTWSVGPVSARSRVTGEGSTQPLQSVILESVQFVVTEGPQQFIPLEIPQTG